MRVISKERFILSALGSLSDSQGVGPPDDSDPRPRGPPAVLGIARTAAAGYSRDVPPGPPLALTLADGNIGQVRTVPTAIGLTPEVSPSRCGTQPGG
ncbi:MAG: hypothetical protein N3E46_05560 [Gemmataceae bacterium]|nr:hypothetical protein [Gemmataceae bacterium]